MEKKQLLEKQQTILALLKEICDSKLDAEYYLLSERMLQKLGRKRNVPFVTGRPHIWACAIIHALGTINFLFDKSSQPYATIDEINEFFGTNKSTTSNKAKQIRDLLKLNYFDDEFSTRKMTESNPFAEYVMVNGFIVPLDTLPIDAQIAVRQARAAGKDMTFTTR
jgi:hypothetical protein